MELSKWLKKTGMSQAEFARRLGATPMQMSLWVGKRREPSLSRAVQIEEETEGDVTCLDLMLAR